MGFNDDTQSSNFNLQEVYENKRHEHLRNMQDKEDEMRQVIWPLMIHQLLIYSKYNISLVYKLETCSFLSINLSTLEIQLFSRKFLRMWPIYYTRY